MADVHWSTIDRWPIVIKSKQRYNVFHIATDRHHIRVAQVCTYYVLVNGADISWVALIRAWDPGFRAYARASRIKLMLLRLEVNM